MKDLNPKEKEGYETIRIQGSITSSEYLKVLDVSERTARNHLKKMVDLGLLRVEGEGKATKYVVIN